MAQANDAVTERNKVAKMLKGTRIVNPSLVAALQKIHSSPATKNNFTAASSELSEQIALIIMSCEDPAIKKEDLATKKDKKVGGRRPKSSEGLTSRKQPRKDVRANNI